RTRAENRLRLASAELYGLFRNDGDPPESMVAGMAMHDLASFPQSCREPDLSYLPPRAIVECSDHWSLSLGAGMRAWTGIAVQIVRRRSHAVLAYLAVTPRHAIEATDHGGF